MASNDELTAQCVSMGQEIKTLTARLQLAEQEILKRAPSGGTSEMREDAKHLFPEAYDEKTSFKDFADEFLDYVEDRDEEMCDQLRKAVDNKDDMIVSATGEENEVKKLYRMLKKLDLEIAEIDSRFVSWRS